MKRIVFLAYEDMKTTVNNLSIKAALLSIVLICIIPYVIVNASGFLSDQIDDSILLFVLLMQVFIPYISLKVSYQSISSEIDEDTHRLILTMPISRFDLVFSKLISRLLFVCTGIVIYTLVSIITSSLVYKPLAFVDTILVSLVSMGLALPFVALGIWISCTTDKGSILSGLKMSIVYAPLLYMWRLIPVGIEIAFGQGSILSPPDPNYSTWQYFILRINPVESHASIVQSVTSSDITIVLPSSLSLPNLERGGIVQYPSTPLELNDPAIYVQESVTIVLSLAIPFVFFLYGYLRLRRREF